VDGRLWQHGIKSRRHFTSLLAMLPDSQVIGVALHPK
jgi:hypothetical protein